ncbi:MAG: primase C-terminal domain-containing protein [Poseidonibacter sp.]
MIGEENIDTLAESKGYKDLPFHDMQENIVDILCAKTGSNDRSFFRVMVAYKFAELSTNMRCNLEYLGSKNIPTNIYALDLAPSGYSKNASMNILEKEIFRKFKDKFMLETMQKVKDRNLSVLAGDLSVLSGLDIADAQGTINKEYTNLPKFLYSFGSSTPEGFKAMRTKLSMAGIGATSNVIDEIGSNLQGNQETMTVQLEAYDTGDSKSKLIKTDSNSDLRGSVPSNFFAFGTQSKLLDGGLIEKQFFELLETGYARRFLIGFVDKHKRQVDMTADEMYDAITSPMTDSALVTMSEYFKELADEIYYNKSLTLDKPVAIKLINYRLECDKIASELKDHEDILKAVIQHGYWRALKLAGVYAFADREDEVLEKHIDNAIAMVEDSIKSFRKMLSREKPYERLAKYISDVGKKVTQVDLVEDLPFYRGGETQKRELMTLATAYGYNNNIVIKKTIKDGIEFLEGDRLKETNLDEITCSWSKDITEGYTKAVSKFNNLHQLVSGNGFHYCSHSFKDGHRSGDKAIKGFNLVIIDVDHGLPIDVCKSLLSDYKFLISTTKRHTESAHRYRIIIPTSHVLNFSAEEHSKFMKNVFDWLPFEVDEQTKDIARKWQSHKGDYWYNDGKMLDVLPFIPDTPKEVQQRERTSQYESVEPLQRWFLMNHKEEDGRNNMLIKYALALFDEGMKADNIRHSVYSLNNQLDKPIDEREIESTVMKTVIKKEIEEEMKE